MAYKVKKRVIRVGESSRAITLPKPWLDYHGEDAKFVTLMGDAILIIAPNGYEKKARKVLDLLDKEKN